MCEDQVLNVVMLKAVDMGVVLDGNWSIVWSCWLEWNDAGIEKAH